MGLIAQRADTGPADRRPETVDQCDRCPELLEALGSDEFFEVGAVAEVWGEVL